MHSLSILESTRPSQERISPEGSTVLNLSFLVLRRNFSDATVPFGSLETLVMAPQVLDQCMVSVQPRTVLVYKRT